MYADDGISENLEPGEEDLLDSKEHGVEINKSKSGWVLLNGEWLKLLKLLGLTYNGWDKTLTSSTHKGASLKMDKWLLLSESKQAEILLE